MHFNLSPKELFKANLGLILLLLIAHVVAKLAVHYLTVPHLYIVAALFDFNLEHNIPTLYSSVMLIVAGSLLVLIAAANAAKNLPYFAWTGLALIFFFLAVDETASLHEHLTNTTRDMLGATGLLYYAWVVPYGIALCALVLAYAKFLLRLEPNIRYLFVAAGAVFVCGAIGFELLGGNQHFTAGTNNVLYTFFYTCEEVFEMVGIALFNFALLTYIAQEFDGFDLTISNR